jgi:Flp pilus assembly protein TadG
MNFRTTNRRDRAFLSCTLVRCFQPKEGKPAKRTLLVRACSLLRHNEHGGSLVEIAVAIPMVMLLITAMITFGLMLNSYLMLSHAVDVGARNLALSRGATTNPCSDAVGMIQSSAPNLSPSSLSFAFTIGSGSFSGSSTGFSGTSTTDCSQAGVSDMVAGDTATVSASYPFQLLVYGWKPTTVNITASTTEVIQ